VSRNTLIWAQFGEIFLILSLLQLCTLRLSVFVESSITLLALLATGWVRGTSIVILQGETSPDCVVYSLFVSVIVHHRVVIFFLASACIRT
jgi:hypothetical protein